MALSGQGHNWDNRHSWSLPISSWAAWRRGGEWPCGCGQGSEGAEGEARLLVKEALGCFLQEGHGAPSSGLGLGPYVVSGLHLSRGSVDSSEEGWALILAPLPAL